MLFLKASEVTRLGSSSASTSARTRESTEEVQQGVTCATAQMGLTTRGINVGTETTC